MKYLKQLAIIIFICLLGELMVGFLPFGFPGNIMAMLLLTFLLMAKLLKEEHIKETGDFLLEVMAVFIIPVSVSMIEHLELMTQIGLQLVLVSLLVLILSFLSCAYTIRFTMWVMRKRGKTLE